MQTHGYGEPTIFDTLSQSFCFLPYSTLPVGGNHLQTNLERLGDGKGRFSLPVCFSGSLERALVFLFPIQMFPLGTKKHKDYNQSGSVVSIPSWKEVRGQKVGQYNLIESG